MKLQRISISFLGALLAASVWSCGTTSETPLLPERRDGMFYTVFADARQIAIDQDKLLMVDMWRPG